MVFRVPPVSCITKVCRRELTPEFLLLHQAGNLVALATQADDQRAGQICVLRKAGDGSAQEVHRLAGHFHAATQAVRKSHHTIDVGVVGEALGSEPFGDLVHHRGRAVHRREQADVIARRHLAVGAHDAHEAGALGLGQQFDRFVVLGVGVVAVGLAKLHVVRVDVAAGLDVDIGKADGDVVLEYGFALGDLARGDLVAGGDLGARLDALLRQRDADAHIGASDDDVVVGVQPDAGSCGMGVVDFDDGTHG